MALSFDHHAPAKAEGNATHWRTFIGGCHIGLARCCVASAFVFVAGTIAFL